MVHVGYQVVQAVAGFISVLIAHAIPFYRPLPVTPYHTSTLSSQGWVLELLNGHPEHMHTELGVWVHVFCWMLIALQKGGIGPSKHISSWNFFLYASVTGLSIWHLGKRFQHSNGTISRCIIMSSTWFYLTSTRYFWEVLFSLSSMPFYTQYVFLSSSTTPIPSEIQDIAKFYPLFMRALGTIDGTHIKCCPSIHEQQLAHNQEVCPKIALPAAVPLCNFNICSACLQFSRCDHIQWCMPVWLDNPWEQVAEWGHASVRWATWTYVVLKLSWANPTNQLIAMNCTTSDTPQLRTQLNIYLVSSNNSSLY